MGEFNHNWMASCPHECDNAWWTSFGWRFWLPKHHWVDSEKARRGRGWLSGVLPGHWSPVPLFDPSWRNEHRPHRRSWHRIPRDRTHGVGRLGRCSESRDCKSDHRSLLSRMWHVHSGRIWGKGKEWLNQKKNVFCQMLIVTGGWNGEVLGSTEVLGYTSYLENDGRGEWRQVTRLQNSTRGVSYHNYQEAMLTCRCRSTSCRLHCGGCEVPVWLECSTLPEAGWRRTATGSTPTRSWPGTPRMTPGPWQAAWSVPETGSLRMEWRKFFWGQSPACASLTRYPLIWLDVQPYYNPLGFPFWSDVGPHNNIFTLFWKHPKIDSISVFPKGNVHPFTATPLTFTRNIVKRNLLTSLLSPLSLSALAPEVCFAWKLF